MAAPVGSMWWQAALLALFHQCSSQFEDSCTLTAQDNELLRELQATQARLNGLDVEDLDAEHESLALAEHALQKLRGSGPAGGEEPPLPAAEEAGGPAKQQQQGRGQGQAQPNGEGATGTGTQPPEEAQKPLALLGPP